MCAKRQSSDNITYKEIYELIDRHITTVNKKLDDLSSKLEEIRIQTTKTNGRVTAIENWECDINKIISELRTANEEQNKKIELTNKDLAILALKISFIIGIASFIVYIITGYVI